MSKTSDESRLQEEGIFNKFLSFHNDRLSSHGFSSKSLWNSKESQFMRFSLLARIIDPSTDFTIVDFGCGLCHFYEYLLEEKLPCTSYTGVDINENMIAKAYGHYSDINLICGSVSELKQEIESTDYIVASGVYNFGESTEIAQNFFQQQFEQLFPIVNKGFAVNFLSQFSERQDNESVYHNPSEMLKMAMETFGPKVALYHHYMPHDFTLLVHK